MTAKHFLTLGGGIQKLCQENVDSERFQIGFEYITLLVCFSLRVYPRNTALSCFICFVFFADHWLCCVEVSADIEPLEYTPKPECPRGSCGALLPTAGDSYDFMG